MSASVVQTVPVAMLFGELLVPILILMIAVAFLVVIGVMAGRYKKIPPNQVGIFYGRKYRYVDVDGRAKTRGFRIVAGGGSLLWPIVEHLQSMSTAAFQTSIDENEIPNKDNVKISVKGGATCKISTTPEDLHNAAMAFLGKKDEEIEVFVRNILIGHLRSIIGKLDIDEVLRQRDTFNRRVIEESTEELKRLGIQVITLVIRDVNDAHGYIDAVGQKTVAEAKRDAAIKVAQADAETKKRVSDAQREAAVVMADNAVKTGDAERDRDVNVAQFKVVADTEKAKANQALAIATAYQEQVLQVTQAQRDAAATEARIAIQVKEADRRKAELEATLIRAAEAERQQMVINADAARQQAIIGAEAAKQKTILEAEATRERAIRTAEGEKQARTLEGDGEAARTRAILLAQADGEAAKTRQALLAQAEGEAALKGMVLPAEAEGTSKLAEALAKMTSDAKLILILDRMPHLLETGGEAASKVMSSIFSSVAAPLGSIDELRIIDVGGSGRGLEQLSSIVPQTVFRTIASLQAQGIDVQKLLAKIGVDVSGAVEMLGQKPSAGKSGSAGADSHPAD
jgi:flotillin